VLGRELEEREQLLLVAGDLGDRLAKLGIRGDRGMSSSAGIRVTVRARCSCRQPCAADSERERSRAEVGRRQRGAYSLLLSVLGLVKPVDPALVVLLSERQQLFLGHGPQDSPAAAPRPMYYYPPQQGTDGHAVASFVLSLLWGRDSSACLR
jgi:hypothetical protein